MAYSIYDHFVANSAGDIVNNATVTVNNAGGGLAQIYVNRLGTPTIDYPSGQLPNPLTVTNGRITFYAAATGRYTVTAVTTDGTVVFSDVLLPAENPATLEDIAALTIENVAALASTPVVEGRTYYLKEYHSGTGLGGGNLLAKSGSTTVDSGSKFNTGTAGVYVERINPQKTPYEFGYQDGDDNLSVAANACTVAYGVCYLDPLKTYNITSQINAKGLISVGGKATINCVSPTANNRFGSTGAAIHCSPNLAFGDTTNTGTLKGVDIQNIVVKCNGLINATGSTGLKGIYNYRNDDFRIRACDVYNCASYAFWAHDDATTGTLFCSGTYDDCYAEDCQVSFEQVNVRGVILNNCVAYISSAVESGTYAQPVECMYHPYGGSDMRVAYNNCIGISDGYCPSIMLGLLECKNVTANDCAFVNNNDEGASIQAAVIFDGSGPSAFDKITFNNCELKSQFSNAVRITAGATGGAEATFKFGQCEINGYQLAVYASGTGGRYSFVDCNTFARATLAVTPICYQIDAGYTSVQVIGGTATASTTGSGTPTISNLPKSIFNGTILTPSTGALPVIRQRVVGTAVFGGDGSTYANLNVTLPSAVLGWTSTSVNTAKISANIQVDYGISGAASFPAAVAMAYPTVISMPANDIVRFVANNVLQGKTARYEVTEWE